MSASWRHVYAGEMRVLQTRARLTGDRRLVELVDREAQHLQHYRSRDEAEYWFKIARFAVNKYGQELRADSQLNAV